MPGRLSSIRRPMPARARSALALALAVLPAAPGRAVENAAEKPAAAVPVPPPLPPERPDTLNPPPEPATPPPTPPTRPAELTPAASPAKEAPASEKAAATAAEPGKPEIPVPPPTPPGRPPELSGESALALKVTPPDDTACRTRLKRLGADFEPLPPIAEGQCTAPLPLKVTKLADGVGLPQGATLTCRTAEALARWVTEVQVEAERVLKHGLTGLELGGTYVCRGQNHDVDAKLSEHAFANAVDVMGFAFSGRAAVPVKAMPEGSDEAQFLTAVRGKACGFFRTVLGPGTNAAHANHFHLDERERTAGHRLCE